MLTRRIITLTAAAVFQFCGWNKVLAQEGPYRGWHMGPDMMGYWGMGWFGGIFFFIFWILIIVGMVFLIKWLIHMGKGHSAERSSGSRALEILRERYAKGEIEKDEFEEKKKDLGC